MTDYNFQKGFSKIDKWRREAAISNNAFNYAVYSDFLYTPIEEQYVDLYFKGIELIAKEPKKAEDLENLLNNVKWDNSNLSKDEKIKKNYNKISEEEKQKILDHNKAFLKEALKYDMNPGIAIEDKVKLLRRFFPRFREDGIDNLAGDAYTENNVKLGRKFQHIVESYEKKYSKLKNNNI